jgi:ABC-2 type transport system ATP-binding protein
VVWSQGVNSPQRAPAIATDRLSKYFGDVRAVHDVSLRVERGEIVGFLGLNGAGKTTTLRMLMGLMVPSAGAARIDGRDCHSERVEVARVAGFLPDTPVFPDYLRGSEVLEFVAEMHGLTRQAARLRARALLEEMDLGSAGDSFAADYSAGMKKRLAFASALIHEPNILVLDEPTNGLDPRGARAFEDRLRRKAAAGGAVLLSTHLLPMVEGLCSRVVIIHAGRLVAAGRLEELRGCADHSLEQLFLRLTAGESESPAGAPAAG